MLLVALICLSSSAREKTKNSVNLILHACASALRSFDILGLGRKKKKRTRKLRIMSLEFEF